MYFLNAMLISPHLTNEINIFTFYFVSTNTEFVL